MNIYMVNVSVDIPHPWPRAYRQEATSEGAAVSRTLKAYHQDVRNRNGKAKKINEFTLKVLKSGTVVNEEEVSNV